jgi:hypothetical protein
VPLISPIANIGAKGFAAGDGAGFGDLLDRAMREVFAMSLVESVGEPVTPARLRRRAAV